MESRTEFPAEATIELGTEALRSFRLFEEYNHKETAEILEMHRGEFENADDQRKMEILTQVEADLDSFSEWLEQTKGLDPAIAYYCATSFKSLLLGIPAGFQIAYLFAMVLEKEL